MVGKYSYVDLGNTQAYVLFVGYDSRHFGVGLAKAKDFSAVKNDMCKYEVEPLGEGDYGRLKEQANLLLACLNIAYSKPREVH